MKDRMEENRSLRAPLPTFRGREVEMFELEEIALLLNSPARSAHSCISKGQLMQVITRLTAENYLLAKALDAKDEDTKS